MPTLVYIALSFIGGYFLGKRSAASAAQPVSAVLTHVGHLQMTGALAAIGDLSVKNGNALGGIELALKGRPLPPRPWGY